MSELSPTPAIWLASRSPRRRDLLAQIGITCMSVPCELDESCLEGETPGDYVCRLALAKACAGRALVSDHRPVLGADTAVVCDGNILGKPVNREDALGMLLELSGRTHEVFTGVALVGVHEQQVLSRTRVTFSRLTLAEAAAYWQTGEPADKAGGYGIQGLGARFVQRIEGSYSGVVGLPLYETALLLSREGIEPLPGAVHE